MVGKLVDEMVLVDEVEIGVAMAEAVIEERLILEGAGATPIAALINRERGTFGDRVALVATGAMVDDTTLIRLVEKHRDQVAAILGRPG
jgi:threonine dehydratase